MQLTIELDREVDGRWIAEVPELNIVLYGDSRQDALMMNFHLIRLRQPSALLLEHLASHLARRAFAGQTALREWLAARRHLLGLS